MRAARSKLYNKNLKKPIKETHGEETANMAGGTINKSCKFI